MPGGIRRGPGTVGRAGSIQAGISQGVIRLITLLKGRGRQEHGEIGSGHSQSGGDPFIKTTPLPLRVVATSNIGER